MNSDYINEMNRYPTIFISFANAKRDRESIITTIKKQILSEWAKYEYVFKNLIDTIKKNMIILNLI